MAFERLPVVEYIYIGFSVSRFKPVYTEDKRQYTTHTNPLHNDSSPFASRNLVARIALFARLEVCRPSS